MIIARMQGGLGNQLFIYAAARCLAIKNVVPLKLDIVSGFKNDRLGRRYCLQRFNIKAEIASKYESFDFCLGREVQYFLRKASKIIPIEKRRYITQESAKVDPRILDLKVRGRIFLEGYWQSEKYFAEIADIIREEFTFKEDQTGQNKEFAQMISSSSSVSVHVRRGDYVSQPKTRRIHHVCGPDYYRRCIGEIAGRVGNPHFFVFSDDTRWCRENLQLDYPVTFVNHNGPDKSHEDLRLMSQCRHHIIANSSFSWWGAWLNSNENKIVLAPKNWFAKTIIGAEDIVPDGWMKM